ncbi:hypothetical protein EIP91_011125 [Steccherinum ochraceum]|uniref:Transcription initiation factor TFIID subunit 8 n=1 Tax=Steccherinum ochraceum TaxID=92696 RepID=A0A4R0S3M2_9APHY|nr:hypothetical protein EIP91_011125 [Steccherinum ochraceum]
MSSPDMNYYSAQGYGSFQASTYPAYTTQAQFQGQYTGQAPPSGYSIYAAGPSNLPTSPHDATPSPDLPAVSPDIASAAVQRLLLSELQDAGFDAASPMALQRFENEVVALIEKLFKFSHDYANHANRAEPMAIDLILAGKRYGLDPKEMYQVGQSWKKRRQNNPEIGATVLLPPASRPPSPELLPSDDEDSAPIMPATLRTLPQFHLPALPPKHTYLRTPISPPKKAALPSLEKKLKNASVVQESLKNLLLATEDNPSSEDKLLFDAAVNWECTVHPRKRWRLGA